MEEEKKFYLDDLCMRCFKVKEENEDFWAFNIYDDNDEEVEIRGHEACILEVKELLEALPHFVEKEEKAE